MPKGIPLTEEELDRRRREIVIATLPLFLGKGFHETSVREIAAAAEMGKSSLYDYFDTKEDILLWAIIDEIRDLTAAVQEIASQPIPARERLRQALRKNLEFLVARKEVYLKLTLEVQRLSIESQQRVQAQRHAYQDLIRRLVEEGVQEGAFRSVDALLVTRVLVAALSPTVFTSRPSGTPQAMLDETFDIIMKGIQA